MGFHQGWRLVVYHIMWDIIRDLFWGYFTLLLVNYPTYQAEVPLYVGYFTNTIIFFVFRRRDE